MSPDELVSVAQRMNENVVPCGTEIITQGDHGDTFYIIEDGEVSVTVSYIYIYVYINYRIKIDIET